MKYQMLRMPEVVAKTGLSRASIYLRMRNGTFPMNVSLGSRASAWVEAEVDAWLEERIREARREAA